MEEMEFNRQVFATQTERPRRSTPPLLGLILFSLVVGALGLAGYAYLKGHGLPAISDPGSQLTGIAQRLEEIEKRLNQLEKRRKSGVVESSAPALEGKESLGPPPPPFVIGGTLGTDSSTRTSKRPDQPPLSSTNNNDAALEQDVKSVRSDLASVREAWEATSERLGRAVGELGAHRSEIAENRETLGHLMTHFERTQYPFELRGTKSRVRAGPIWLQLRDTNDKKQRYTLGLYINDRWVEIKDRVLQEPVEFYVTESALPFELVVTEIDSNRVMGRISVPSQFSTARQNNPK